MAHAFVAAFLCLGIGACSAGDDSSSVIEQTPEAVDVADPESPLECEVPQCVETGFLSDPDGFSFANWSDTGALDASSLVDMFGEEVVCIEGGTDECLLSPSADQWLTQANSAMTVGHCEGMAALAQEIFQGTRPLDMYNPNAPFTFACANQGPSSSRSEQPWASQLLPDLQPKLQFRKMQLRGNRRVAQHVIAIGDHLHHGSACKPRSWSHRLRLRPFGIPSQGWEKVGC